MVSCAFFVCFFPFPVASHCFYLLVVVSLVSSFFALLFAEPKLGFHRAAFSSIFLHCVRRFSWLIAMPGADVVCSHFASPSSMLL